MKGKEFTESELYALALAWQRALKTFRPKVNLETYIEMVRRVKDHQLLKDMISRYNRIKRRKTDGTIH